MSEQELSLTEIVRSLMEGCNDIEDIAHALIPYLDRNHLDEFEQDELAILGIERVIELKGLEFEDAKQQLINQINKIIRENYTIN